jgi:hypothetical protein
MESGISICPITDFLMRYYLPAGRVGEGGDKYE